MDLSDFRKEYSDKGLRRAELGGCPVEVFEGWFQKATEVGVYEANAMSLATVDGAGHPSQRTVLLKSCDARGFVFFSNYESRKAGDIEGNANVSLLFPWITMERQVIVRGRVEKISREDSLAYFSTRPRESQIGAWVSNQSEVIDSRDFLLEKLEVLQERFCGIEVPLPDFWGGYRVVPESIEFWQGGPGRVHDRFLYTRIQGGGWDLNRLSP